MEKVQEDYFNQADILTRIDNCNEQLGALLSVLDNTVIKIRYGETGSAKVKYLTSDQEKNRASLQKIRDDLYEIRKAWALLPEEKM